MKKIIFFTALFCFLLTTAFFAYSANPNADKSSTGIKRATVDKIFILKTKAPITKDDLKNIKYPTTVCFADEPVLINVNCNAPDGSCVYTYSITIRCYTFNLN